MKKKNESERIRENEKERIFGVNEVLLKLKVFSSVSKDQLG